MSIPTRILAWFLLLLALIGAAGAVSVARMRGAARDIEAVNRGVLQMTLLLSELEATQASLVNLLAEERPMGVQAVRKARFDLVTRARRVVTDAIRGGVSRQDHRFLTRVIAELLRLEAGFRRNEARFDALFPRGGARPPPEGVRALGRDEGEVLRRTRALREAGRQRLTEVSLAVENEVSRAVLFTLVVFLAALGAGAVAAFRAQRTLRPLERLAEGARAIARGSAAERADERAPGEIGQLAAEFNRMAAALREREARLIRTERLAAAGKVAAQVAHEIRNPLSAIGLNAELLEEDLPADAEARACVRAIRAEVDRLEEITESYLSLSRMPRPRVEPTDVGAMLRSLVEFCAAEMRQAGVEVAAEIGELPPVAADDRQLRRVFLNILRNAREAMREGGLLRLSARAADGAVEVEIADSGPGIPPEARERVFDPFYTTKERGTGLGLAIAQEIVREHGGTLALAGDPGRGARFTVRLPAQPGGPARAP